MKAYLERFTRSAHTNENLEPSWEVVASAVSDVADEWSASVRLDRDDTDQLFVSASNGRYAVMMRRGEEFFDLVGDSGRADRIEFVHGGQAALHPSRFVVPLPLALSAAKEFLHSKETDAVKWERQGAQESP